MQTPHSETPENAVERFLNSRIADDGISEKTVRNNRYNLKKFSTWADTEGFDDMSEMDGLRADDFKTWVMQSDLAHDAAEYRHDIQDVSPVLRESGDGP